MPQSPEFVIRVMSYHPDIGGEIALHTLCHRLNEAGASAALWPDTRPAPAELRGLRAVRKLLGWAWRTLRRVPFDRGGFPSPVARARDLRDAIVIYPEVTRGNPLGADKVVRWFLNKPGVIGGEPEYGADEYFFFYTKAFDDPRFDVDPDNLLRITRIDPAYRQTNFGERQGSCLIVRKGKDRVLNQHPADAILVDHLNHAQMAEVFNRVETLYTYDPYTLFTLYAAICGCTPVYLPPEGMTPEEWQPGGRVPGLAFGGGEKDWAVRTRPDLLARVEADLAEEARMVERFIAKCRARFGRSEPDQPA